MVGAVTGQPLSQSRGNSVRNRMSDWSFLAQLTQANRQYISARAGVAGGYHVALGWSPLQSVTSASSVGAPATSLKPPAPTGASLRRAAVSVGDQGGAAATTGSPPTEAAAPVSAIPTTTDPTQSTDLANGVLPLDQYPRPPGDTGRGFHWIPTLVSGPSVVDNYVDKARQLGASWVTFLNDGSNVGQNDYLVQRLVKNHIEPIMRIYTDHGRPIDGDVSGMLR